MLVILTEPCVGGAFPFVSPSLLSSSESSSSPSLLALSVHQHTDIGLLLIITMLLRTTVATITIMAIIIIASRVSTVTDNHIRSRSLHNFNS